MIKIVTLQVIIKQYNDDVDTMCSGAACTVLIVHTDRVLPRVVVRMVFHVMLLRRNTIEYSYDKQLYHLIPHVVMIYADWVKLKLLIKSYHIEWARRNCISCPLYPLYHIKLLSMRECALIYISNCYHIQ